ncbi:hypothetical protein J6590_012948 [Homalodisca vitripennis]|nr:hypothetical protein J6590_012948 [Homalodisca vitripennis]
MSRGSSRGEETGGDQLFFSARDRRLPAAREDEGRGLVAHAQNPPFRVVTPPLVAISRLSSLSYLLLVRFSYVHCIITTPHSCDTSRRSRRMNGRESTQLGPVAAQCSLLRTVSCSSPQSSITRIAFHTSLVPILRAATRKALFAVAGPGCSPRHACHREPDPLGVKCAIIELSIAHIEVELRTKFQVCQSVRFLRLERIDRQMDIQTEINK